MQAQFYLSSLKATQQFGKQIGQIAPVDTLITLSGQIGSGKTTLVKAIGHGLGIEETIASPTFVMMNEYHSGRLSLYHLDLYRLIDQGSENVPFEVIFGQLAEVFDTGALVMIEWAEVFANQFGRDLYKMHGGGFLSLNISTPSDNEQARIITIASLDEKDEKANKFLDEVCKLSKDILM